jgi:cytochrome c
MDTMEITKFVGAICGSLLVFLLVHTAAGGIFHVGTEAASYTVPVEEAAGGDEGGGGGEQIDVAALVASADAAKGEAVFKKCAACHKIDNTNAVGPHLNGVVGRPVGAVEDYAYSDPMQSHGGDWSPDNLFAFLENPKKVVPGTKMSFAGLPKPDDRANVIAYLEAHAN